MRDKLISQVLQPVVRIRTNNGRGSGTVVHSSELGTYLLTNHHVIKSCIEYKEVWDELLRRNVKKQFTSTVEVDMSRMAAHGVLKGLNTVISDIVMANEMQDLALLKLRDDLDYEQRHACRITVMITAGFFGVLGWMLNDASVIDSPPLLIMLGSLGTAWTGSCAFWFGTTQGSMQKSNLLAQSTPVKE